MPGKSDKKSKEYKYLVFKGNSCDVRAKDRNM